MESGKEGRCNQRGSHHSRYRSDSDDVRLAGGVAGNGTAIGCRHVGVIGSSFPLHRRSALRVSREPIWHAAREGVQEPGRRRVVWGEMSVLPRNLQTRGSAREAFPVISRALA